VWTASEAAASAGIGRSISGASTVEDNAGVVPDAPMARTSSRCLRTRSTPQSHRGGEDPDTGSASARGEESRGEKARSTLMEKRRYAWLGFSKDSWRCSKLRVSGRNAIRRLPAQGAPRRAVPFEVKGHALAFPCVKALSRNKAKETVMAVGTSGRVIGSPDGEQP
jgi:hypothetical protein